MGLDLGDKTIGVAVSDAMKWTAQGVETIRRKSLADDVKRLEALIKEYEVESIVLGLPKNMDGSIGPRAEIVQEFAQHIGPIVNIPIYSWDERLSTVAAERALLEADISRKKRKKVIDKMAAVIILQGYLDTLEAK